MALIADSGTHTVSMLTLSSLLGARITYLEGESVDAGGRAQEGGDGGRVILPVAACEARQERQEAPGVCALQAPDASVVVAAPSLADVWSQQRGDAAVVQPVHGPVESISRVVLLELDVGACGSARRVVASPGRGGGRRGAICWPVVAGRILR